jgi:hypothetical protein
MTKVYIDVDSTVADHMPRMLRYSQPFTRDAVMTDSPIKDSVKFVSALHDVYGVSFLTARSWDMGGKITKDWLDLYDFEYNDIHVVHSPYDKIAFMNKRIDSILIDDMSWGQEKGSQYKNHYDCMHQIKNLVLFKGDWSNSYQDAIRKLEII